VAGFYPCRGSGGQAPSIRNAERKADEGLTAIPIMNNMVTFYNSLVITTHGSEESLASFARGTPKQ